MIFNWTEHCFNGYSLLAHVKCFLSLTRWSQCLVSLCSPANLSYQLVLSCRSLASLSSTDSVASLSCSSKRLGMRLQTRLPLFLCLHCSSGLSLTHRLAKLNSLLFNCSAVSPARKHPCICSSLLSACLALSLTRHNVLPCANII